MNQIQGLLTQKPTSPVPEVGQTRRFSWEERKSKNGTDWIKIKSEGEGYGQPYEIKSVQKTNHTDSHGNVSYNVTIEPKVNGATNGNGNRTQGETQSTNKDDSIRWLTCLKVAGMVHSGSGAGHAPPIITLAQHLYAASPVAAKTEGVGEEEPW